MSTKSHHFLRFCCLIFFASNAQAVTLTSGQTDYTTTGDITTSASGIITSLSGTSSSLNKIKNTFTITTGNSGATASAYGIRSSGNYYQITNDTGATILTTGISGRGISVANFTNVYNLGTINTQGTTSYGIYLGGNSNTASNSGLINTLNTTSYGIYLNGNNNSVTNSGTVSAAQSYGIYLNGDANQITNSGTINTSGSTSYGIYVSTGTASTASSSNYSTVNNAGTINSSSHGIYSKDNYTQITNSGTITTGSGSSIYGIRSEGDNSTISNSGNIISTNYAIYNSGAGAVITNSGNLTGGIRLGGGVLNILGGTISGEVDGASGSVNINSSFNQSTDFNDLIALNINSGSTLTSSASIDAGTISIDENATLTLQSGFSVSGTIQGLSDSVGTLNISGVNFSPSNAIGISGNALANLNINSGASVTTASDIYAANILLDGSLNFYAADNLSIFGNVAGSGAGVINIGSKSQIVTGDFSLIAGDTLAISLGDEIVGNLAVDGLANISADTKLAITTGADQGYISDGTKLTIINAASGSSINAINSSNISINGAVSNSYGLLKFTTQATDNSLILNINRLTASEVTTNKNTQNIYQNLNEIGANTSGELLQFQEYLDSSGLSGDALTQTINQLAPQSSKAALAVSSNIVRNSMMASETRLAKVRNDLADGFWVESFGSAATQNTVKYDEGYQTNSIGFIAGLDREISSTSLIGAALSYARSDVKSTNKLQNNLITTHQINFYSSQNFGKFFLNNVVGFAWNQFSSNRSILALNSNATARYFGQTYAAKISSGFVKNFRRGFSLTPELSLNFLRNNVGGYSENGADTLNLKVQAVTADFMEGQAGLKLGWESKVKKIPEFTKLVTSLKASYGYSFVNDAPNTSANFIGQSSNFNWQITQTDRQSLRFGGAIEAYYLNDVTFGFECGLEKKSTYQSHFVMLKIRQEF